jgi:hypothetical protein
MGWPSDDVSVGSVVYMGLSSYGAQECFVPDIYSSSIKIKIYVPYFFVEI